MGFFSDLTNLSLGGQIGKSLTGRDKSTGSLAWDLAKGPKKPKPPEPFNPANRIGATIGGKSGVDQPAQRLGWTNGGYTYANSPWNKEPAGAGMQTPMPPPNKAPAMGFGGPPTGVMSSPKTPPMQMPMQPPQGGPPMGMPQGPPRMAQPMPQGPQTMGMPPQGMDPRMMQQMMVANQLRQGSGRMM